MEAYLGLVEYWREECPPANVMIKAIAQTLGCKFGSDHRPTELDAEHLFQTMRIDPRTAPVWNPKPLQATLGRN